MLFVRPAQRLGWRPPRTGDGPQAADRPRRCRALLAAVALPLLLAACGDDDNDEPAATVAVATVAGDATVGLGPTSVASPAVGSPLASPGAASPVAGAPATLGELADRINAAWAGVRSFRSEFVSRPIEAAAPPVAGAATPGSNAAAGASPVASPDPRPGTVRITREVVLPDRQRQRTRRDRELRSEAIAVGGRIYVRGPLARSLRPDADERAWVEVDPAALDPNTEIGRELGGLVAPVTPPTASVSENLRPQELRPLGGVEVAGRSCQAYGAAGTTETGERIDLTISIDANDLVCAVETRAGGNVSILTYEAYDEPLTIEPPADTIPAGSPVPATPGGQD